LQVATCGKGLKCYDDVATSRTMIDGALAAPIGAVDRFG